MAKKLLHQYTFDASAKTVTLDGIYGQERILMISNVTDNIIIFVFNQTAFGLSNYAIDTVNETTTLTLTYDTTSMSDTDKLQIFVEMDSVPIAPSETYVDPVSKIRVTNPENLIDTDFEYGLQSTKWETLELVKNIPTFYSRNGDESLNLSTVTKTNGSEIISVVTSENHNLSIGNPIIVQGTDSISADGAFIVTAIPSETSFQYKAKANQSGTGSILDTYTQIFVGSVYQGTEFQLSALNAITTDGANPSVLTVETEDPTNFSVDTSFFLSNSLGSKAISVNAANVEPNNHRTKQESFTHYTATDDGDKSEWAIGAIQPYNWTPARGMFFIIGDGADSDVTFDLTNDTITFATNHVFNDGEAVMFIHGLGNTNPGGMSERVYWVRTTADPKTIYLTTGGPSAISKVNITSTGANAGHMRSCLAYGLKASSVNTSSEVFTFDQNFSAANGQHPAGLGADTPYIAMYSTFGGFSTVAVDSLTSYYETDSTSRSYYLKPEAGTQNTASFSDTVGGSNKNANSGTVSGIAVPMKKQVDGDRNSFYLPRAGWVENDIVWYDSQSAPSGLANNGLYRLKASGAYYPNRFRLEGIDRNPSNTDEDNFTNYGGTTNTISGFYQTNAPRKVDATGETGGWALGSVQPINWLPEEAFFFVGGTAAGSNISVNTSTEEITFVDAHGMVDGKTYVYIAGTGNSPIGGLTSTRWYYVTVVNANTIKLSTSSGGSFVNLTSAGTNVGIVRSCFARVYRGVSFNSGEGTITMAEDMGVTSGQDQILANVYGTFNNIFDFDSDSDLLTKEVGDGSTVYPLTVTPDGLTLTFSNQLGGSKRALNTSGVTTGALMKVKRAPDANSIWYPNHGLQTDDVIQHWMTSTAISGMTNGEYYKVTRVNANRISFQLNTSNNPVNFANYGNGASTTYTYYITRTLVASGDYIHATAHGLNNGDAVTYNANNGGLIRPLVDGTTYYVQNATTDKFQLSTTASGVDGDVKDIVQTTSYFASEYYVNITAHGFNTGDRVVYTSSTPVAPLKSGAYYYVYRYNNNRFYLHMNYDTAITNEGYGRIYFAYPISGSGTFQKTTVVDLASKGTGTQIFNATTPGSTDGVYKIASIVDSTKFTFNAGSQVQKRIVNFTPNSSVWIEQDAIKIPDHNFVTGQDVAYSNGTTATPTTFVITQSNSNFYIDGVQQPTLELMEGNTYIFDQSDATNTTHLLKFSTTSDGTHNSGTEYTTGVTYSSASSGSAGAFTQIVVPVGVATLYYYCNAHPGMGGQANTPSATTTAVGGLTTNTTYFVIRISRNWIKLAASLADANAGTNITLTSQGDGIQQLLTDSLVGEVIGGGTVSADQDSSSITGTETNFTSFFNTGDTISIYADPTRAVKSVSGIDTNTSLITTSPAHGLSTGDMIIMDSGAAPAGTINGRFYYVRVSTTTKFYLHNSAADAQASANTVAITDTGNTVAPYVLTDIGATYTNTVKAVTGIGSLQLESPQPATVTDANFTIGSSLLMRADGFAIHRPYDGGVELIPSKNPDSRMIRQTRRYFRYQSGKGIQVSFAVNFSPSIQIDSYTAVGTTATIVTRYPHRLVTSLNVVISGAVETSGTNYWNGTFAVASVVDDYTFTVTLSGTPGSASSGPSGIPEFYLGGWSGSALRCGLFDDQNGLFFEYDGSVMSVCRRNATTQISGEGGVTFRSGTVTGVGTKYTKQLNLNDHIVIKGQTYVVTKITSDTNISILPTYRGTSNSGVVITKVLTTKVAQTAWNIDKCDGTGPSGFVLNASRIQMAYMDYSWYGAGKVRFGFKDQYGKVIYVHEFIHNNIFREAYMRSGNVPARYEIENVGTPSFVPALAHWGTSVIMDGGFDPDSAYQFTASSQDIQITGANTVTVAANAEYQYDYYYYWNNQWRNLGRALQIATPSYLYNSIPSNVPITGANISNRRTRNPSSYFGLPAQPYQVSLRTRLGYSNSGSEEIRNLILINGGPTGSTNTTSNYTVTASTTGVPVVYDIPLISIRLAPSVDTNTPGFLGEREIVNRMQLILRSVGILSTHNCNITLRLNALITNTDWSRVENPSLSQLIYHNNQDQVAGGIDIFNFRAQGGTGSTGRSAVVTTQDLGEITTLGNSILGGNNVFPDGPDVLTIVARLVEDPSTVSTSNPFNVTGRISWTESQA